ncbi:MAG: hypothetical protein VR72_05070 [Clostridiaceae bacterium BRH_c20a]|nr:MAG: hypothetical protein VR72_05070 [Clostridiaceae bacterium BRH_c20a]
MGRRGTLRVPVAQGPGIRDWWPVLGAQWPVASAQWPVILPSEYFASDNTYRSNLGSDNYYRVKILRLTQVIWGVIASVAKQSRFSALDFPRILFIFKKEREYE